MEVPEDNAPEQQIQRWGLSLPATSHDVERHVDALHSASFVEIATILERREGTDDAKRAYYQFYSSEETQRLYLRLRNNIHGLVHITWNRRFVDALGFDEVLQVEDYLVSPDQQRIAATAGTVRRKGPHHTWSDGRGLGPILGRTSSGRLSISPLDSDYNLTFPSKRRIFPARNGVTQVHETGLVIKYDRVERARKLLERLRFMDQDKRVDDITF